MKISTEEVQHVAKLARLELSEEEVLRMTEQLDNILQYVDSLEALDTSGVEATTHTQNVTNAFREDVARESLSREKALANGPEHNNTTFTVPRVIG